MILSLGAMLLLGLVLGELCKKVHFPSLFGMIIAGVLLGPYVFQVIDDSVLSISADLRRIALVIILIRAGLKLCFTDLTKVGRPAILMCFVPAMLEMAGMYLYGPLLFGLSNLESLILGSVIAAVSPAVIVPKMIKLIDEGYGTKEGIPQMILAGASVDDVFVIVMFTTFTGLAGGKKVSWIQFVQIPVSIVLGILGGILLGILLLFLFQKVHLRDTVKAMILLAVSFLLLAFEDNFKSVIPFASLISVMAVGTWMRYKNERLAKRLSAKFDKMWVPSEIILFVLVGASVALDHVKQAGIKVIALLLIVLLFRMLGVWLCFLGTKLPSNEKLFCMLAYCPKATVQAAIGGLPLAMGLACGDFVLTVSVIAILLTAPLGAFMIDLTYKKLLKKEDKTLS